MVRDPGIFPHHLRRSDLDCIAHQQCGNQPGHSVVSCRDGTSPLADVAVSGWQVEPAEYIASSAPLSASQAAASPGIHLGRYGGLAVDRSPGRVLDYVAPTREDTRSHPSKLLWVSVA